MRGRRHRGQRGGIDPYVMMLALQLVQRIQRLERKPPVTLSLMAFMTALFVLKGYPDVIIPTSQSYALCPSKIIANGEIARLFVSAFLHGDHWHLYHNMASFLWKGVNLEFRLGTAKFIRLLLVLLLASHTLFVAVSVILLYVSNLDSQPYYQCAIGFSAVLFALKVVLNVDSPTHSNVYGIQVPTKYAAWLELAIIHFLVPNSSFLGHMCGILAGYIYVKYRYYINAIRMPQPSSPRYTYAQGHAETDEETARRLQKQEFESKSSKVDELRRRRLNRFR